MKIKDGYMLRQLGSQPVVVATGDAAQDFKGLVRLHGTGSFLWEQLADHDCTAEDLVEALLAEYNVDRETAQSDVESFLEIVIEEGFAA